MGDVIRRTVMADRKAERAREQATRKEKRARDQAAKEEKQRHIESRIATADKATQEVANRITQLQELLLHTLRVNDTIYFESLRPKDLFPTFSADPSVTTPCQVPQEAQFLAGVHRPNSLLKLLPPFRQRHKKALLDAQSAYQNALTRYQSEEETRQRKLDAARQDYEQAKAQHDATVKQRNAGIDRFKADYIDGNPEAVVAYNNMLLKRSQYPDNFPQEFRTAYMSDSQELVIEYELPSLSVIPTVAEYRYVKTKDVIEEKPRKPSETKELYQDVVASVALRTIHEVFEADQANQLNVVAFNGFVQATDAATGKDIRPCLVSLRVTKERFSEINLSRIDKKVCLRNLGAQVSPRPDEVQPVKPIVEFDMVDKRFVEQGDILSDLESRPNLMNLNPFEFENLVSNLFTQLGLETKLTRSHRDGGVDVVAFDMRPVLGGRVVIQAKRYKNTVGVSAVRDLYGTMMNEGANKGILVTTSGYGPDAFDFAKDKPIELMDGAHLLYLLEQVGVKARIVFPDDCACMATAGSKR